MTPLERVWEPITPTTKQAQASSTDPRFSAILSEAHLKATSENPTWVLIGYRVEETIEPDNGYGAGVPHYNLTAYFRDTNENQEALNPRNLNAAPVQVFGQTLTEEELREKGIGQFDTHRKTI